MSQRLTLLQGLQDVNLSPEEASVDIRVPDNGLLTSV
jgi:hypothetical protein